MQEHDSEAIRCGPRGAEWREDQAVFPCPCGLSIQRSRFARHVRDCPIQPCPIGEIKGSFKEVVALVREGADRRVTCFCGKLLTASAKDVSVAKALARHFTSHHRGMTAAERIQRRRAIFSENHVLVAMNPQVAIRADLPLHPSAYDAAMAEKARHGSSKAQGMAPWPRSRRRSTSFGAPCV